MTTHEANEAGERALQIAVRGIAAMCHERWDAPLSEARKIIYVKVAMALFLKVNGNNVMQAEALFNTILRDLAPGSMRIIQ